MEPSTPWDAVLLAGGRAARLAGIDKTALLRDGRSLLEHSLGATAAAERVALVGPDPGPVGARVRVTREDPPGSGPVAAIGAGLTALARPGRPAWTLLLACDLARPEQALPPLLAHLTGPPTARDGLVAVDDDGRRQLLLCLLRTAPLLAAVSDLTAEQADGSLADLSVRRLLGGLRLDEVAVASSACADADTPDDVRRLGLEQPPDQDTAG